MKLLKKYKSIIELSASFILAFSIILIFFKERKNFENLALGVYTKEYFGKVGDYPIQVLGFRNEDLIIKGCVERENEKQVLILGNSQTHSINQFKKGDATFVKVLSDSLSTQSIDVISSSVPNGTLEDFYLLYMGWKSKIKLNALILPVFLDDTREEGIQELFYKELGAFQINDSIEIAFKVNDQLKALNQSEKNDFAALKQTFQEQTENNLNEYLDKNFEPWHLRPNIRGDFFNNLYKIRNTAFGIDAKTKRGIIKNVYARNIKAFDALLENCQKENLPVLVYIPPIRNDFEVPYYQSEYQAFKKEIEALCVKYHAGFKNLENAVPNQYWGLKGTRTLKGLVDLDFMHFQYNGHIIMANTLKPEIEKIVKR